MKSYSAREERSLFEKQPVQLSGLVVVKCAKPFALLLLAVIFSAAFHSPVLAEAPSQAERVAALNAPATVFVLSVWNAVFSYPFALYDVDISGRVTIEPHPEEGTLTEQIEDYVSWGSGFIITPDGYILTNAHVATTQLDHASYIEELAVGDALAHLQNGDFDRATAESYLEARINFYTTYGKFSPEQLDLTVVMGVTTIAQGTTPKGIAAELEVAGDMVGSGSNKDVALIKVVPDFALPTVQLGDSSQVSVGQSVFVIGYPAIESATTSVSQVVEPTVTAGIVSALKDMPGQWKVIQTDATVHHGNSGGPGLNADGQVIGLATFGASSNGQELPGINFLIPINIAKEFLNQANVEPKRGEIDQDWANGLDLFWNNHYSAAINEFRKVSALYPGHPYADRYTQRAEQAIAAGKDVPILFGISGLSWPLLGAAIAVLAVAAIAVVVVVRRRHGTPVTEPQSQSP